MTLATSLTPSRLKLPGIYNFNVEFVIESRRKMIDFSERLNKLFVDINSWTELRIRVDNPSPDLFIRALPVYADETDFKLPVKRCPNHSRPEDTSNINFPLTEHFIRNGELVIHFLLLYLCMFSSGLIMLQVHTVKTPLQRDCLLLFLLESS